MRYYYATNCITTPTNVGPQKSPLQYPPSPPTSFISDDNEDEVFTSIVGNPSQIVPYVPEHLPHPVQLCQQLTHNPDTQQFPTPKNCGQPDFFRPYDIPDTSTTSAHPLPNAPTVIEGLQKMMLHAQMESNVYVTGCLVCSKPYEQVIEATVAN